MDKRFNNNNNLNNSIQGRNIQNNINNESQMNNAQKSCIPNNLHMQNTPAEKNENFKSGGQFSTNNNQYYSTNQYNSNTNFVKGKE